MQHDLGSRRPERQVWDGCGGIGLIFFAGGQRKTGRHPRIKSEGKLLLTER
jgi:hypothetical protein